MRDIKMVIAALITPTLAATGLGVVVHAARRIAAAHRDRRRRSVDVPDRPANLGSPGNRPICTLVLADLGLHLLGAVARLVRADHHPTLGIPRGVV